MGRGSQGTDAVLVSEKADPSSPASVTYLAVAEKKAHEYEAKADGVADVIGALAKGSVDVLLSPIKGTGAAVVGVVKELNGSAEKERKEDRAAKAVQSMHRGNSARSVAKALKFEKASVVSRITDAVTQASQNVGARELAVLALLVALAVLVVPLLLSQAAPPAVVEVKPNFRPNFPDLKELEVQLSKVLHLKKKVDISSA